MPEEPTANETASTQTESPGWIAGLPDDLKKNETFKNFKTVGEFAKHHLEVAAKVPELEGKLGDYVPKLPDDATDEERNMYLDALGRPKTSSEYEFEGEDKNAPEWTSYWKQQFHSLGLTKSQAKTLSAQFNTQIQQMVEAHNKALKDEMTAAETKLRSEMGDKFDTNVELAKRMTVKHLGSEFDKTFANLNGEGRFGVVRLLMKVAELTGEDRSPQAGISQSGTKANSFISYDKSPAPPRK
jgi:hypothetical protein